MVTRSVSENLEIFYTFTCLELFLDGSGLVCFLGGAFLSFLDIWESGTSSESDADDESDESETCG